MDRCRHCSVSLSRLLLHCAGLISWMCRSLSDSSWVWIWCVQVQVSFIFLHPHTLSHAIRQLVVCSRQVFAFSRDGALPFSSTIRLVNPRTSAPVFAVWFSAVISLLLGLLAFAGASAVGAVFSLVVAGQYVAYSIPISARFLGHNNFKPGPFRLGRFVSLINPCNYLRVRLILSYSQCRARHWQQSPCRS